MRKTLLLGSLLALMMLLFTTPALADATGFYVGGSIGRSTIDIGIIPKEPTNVAYKLFGGYRYGALALEGGYVTFGDTSDDYLFLPLDINVDGLHISGILNLPLGPIDLFGKAGILRWDYSLDSALGPDSAEGTDSFYGFGAAIRAGPVGLRAEAEIYDVEPIEKIVLFTVGAVITF